LIYPKTSIGLTLNVDDAQIIPDYPVYTTTWMGNVAACNINSFVPYKQKDNGYYQCRKWCKSMPITVLQGCDFDYIKFTDQLSGETVIAKIYDSEGEYITNINIEDTTD
jgi:hypothetical protein